ALGSARTSGKRRSFNLADGVRRSPAVGRKRGWPMTPDKAARLVLLAFALSGAAFSTATGQSLEPPIAPRIAHTVKSPQGDRIDEYYWLRDDDPKSKRPEIMSYLRAEKAYADAYTAPLQPLRARLVAETRARIKEDDSSVPYYDNGYWYWRQFAT